ncbi:MAG: D-Ala-D-Ala carboxypeptidase family metallohydrolase, partial [Eubacterium sp.]
MRIIDVQNALKTLGYDPKVIDGLDGPDTQAAVMAFQRDVSIEADGIVGPVTTEYLQSTYENAWASEHFAVSEYRCDCDGAYCNGFPTTMDYGLLRLIEGLRNNLGGPVIITSGVRCEIRNDAVGGIANSKHKMGKAADLYSPEVHYTGVAAVARDLGLGVIEYAEGQFV